MKSVWQDNWNPPKFERLQKDMSTDVLIIGGGMAGLLCAHELNEAGVDYILVEARGICSGITKNTTAKITSQHGLVYDKLQRQFGVERSRLYLEANETAVKRYRELSAGIDCAFEDKTNYVYTIDAPNKIHRELLALRKIGYSARLEEKLPIPVNIAAAVGFEGQAQFDPLRFVSAMVQGLRIYENTPVRELRGMTAVTAYGHIKAKSIIIATHFPFLNKHGAYYLKLYQSRSYVLALENAAQVDGMYVDEAGKGMSFRNYGDLLLLGGGGHRTGKKGGDWQELEQFAARQYPDSRIKYRWATQDCMTLDGAPYIGRYSTSTPDLYVATGFNKWGMTTSMVAAMVLSDLVQGRENRYENVFSPSRSILRPQLLANAAEAVVSLVTPTKKRCPHLGCALKWNATERTWDCPCHGSRFTAEGKLIDNPATGDLESAKDT